MKNSKMKILSIILTFALLLGTVPYFTATASDATANGSQKTVVSVIENFDNGTEFADNALNSREYIKLSNKVSISGDTSLMFSTADATTEIPTEDISANYLTCFLGSDRVNTTKAPDTTKTGIRMWVKNTATNTVKIVVWTNGENELIQGMTYYLQDKAGAVTSKTVKLSGFNNKRYVEAPAGFEGWIYIEYTSFNQQNHTQVRLAVHQNDVSTGALYIDSVQSYDGTPEVSSIQNFDYGTALKVSDGKLVNSKNEIIANNSSYISLSGDYFYTGGNSVKFSSVGETGLDETESKYANYMTFFVERTDGFTAIDTSKTGIKMWVKNEATADIKMPMWQTGTASDSSIISGTYYLEDAAGGVASKTTVSLLNGADLGSHAISIPAGFEGWIYIPHTTFKKLDSYLRLGLLKSSVNTGALYIDSVMNYEGNPVPNIVQSFDNGTTITNQSSIGAYVSLSTDYSNSGDTSIKLSTEGKEYTASSWVTCLMQNDRISNWGTLKDETKTGFRMWVKNTTGNDVLLPVWTTTENRLSQGAQYFLQDASGKFTKCTVGAAISTFSNKRPLTIPKDYEGWVYIRYDSYESVGNTVRFAAQAEAVSKGAIYVDSIQTFTMSDGSLPTVFSNAALFQQNKPISIWGKNEAGAVVTADVYMGEDLIETVSATTDDTGRFELSLKARKGGYDSYYIELSDEKGFLSSLDDVLIGELWLSGGQSNMEFVVGKADSSDDILNNVNSEYLRFFLEPGRPYENGTVQPNLPCDDIANAYWAYGNTTGTEVRDNMSAVGAVFAYNLQKELDVPVGVINTAVGGTRINQWLSRDAIEGHAKLLEIYKDKNDPDKNNILYFDVNEEQTKLSYTSTVLYNAKIAPLAGLNIAGTIWYQGESNSNYYDRYAMELDLLKSSWGEIFGYQNDDMPFIYTQVAPDCYDNGEGNWFQLGFLAEAMNDAFKMNENNNTAMLTLYDVSLEYGNYGAIHPNTKIPVGERFANAAMSLCYDGTNEASAPVFESIEIKGNTVYVNFTHVGDGLTCNGGDIHGFNIAGEDGIYVNAKAKIIDKDTVMVWNDYLKSPVNVTYAFANMNQGSNLYNSVGLPAAPFRSDRTVERADSMNKFLTIEEWMFADYNAWESEDTNLSSFKDSWTVNGATYDYNTEVKTEGKASLEVTYSETDTVSVSPVINTYHGKAFDIARFNNIKLDVKANIGAKVSLIVGDKEYDAVELVNDGFNTVLFALEDEITAKATVTFKISGLDTTGVFYIDNIAVGMTDAAAVYGDVNDDGDLNGLDLTVLRKHLLEIETEINLDKADANCDTRINICDLVRAAKSITK